jgi:hypothetical protein
VVSLAMGATFEEIEKRAPIEAPKPRVPPTIDTKLRKAWTQLKKLLLSRDVAMIDQGVELVRSLNDPVFYDELLKGVTWVAPTRNNTLGQLSFVGSFFEDTGPARPYRERAVLALVAAAPPSCAPAATLRATVRSLSFGGSGDYKNPLPVDLAPLTSFASLVSLVVNGNVSEVEHPEALARLSSLEQLEMRVRTPPALPELSTLQRLKKLTLHGVTLSSLSSLSSLTGLGEVVCGTISGDGVLSLDALTRLEVVRLSTTGGLTTLTLRGCRSLRELSLNYAQALHTLDVTGCSALATLTCSSFDALDVVRGLEDATSLTSIAAKQSNARWLMGLSPEALPALTWLSLAGFRGDSLASFPHAPRLGTLTLSWSQALSDVSPLAKIPSLQSIDLRWSPNITDIAALASLPKLVLVQVRGTKVNVASLPDALRRITR